MPLKESHSRHARRPSCNTLFVIVYATVFYAIYFLLDSPWHYCLHWTLDSICVQPQHLEESAGNTSVVQGSENATPSTSEACGGGLAYGLAHCIALHEACRGVKYCITIHVFAHRRVDATRRLLEALASSAMGTKGETKEKSRGKRRRSCFSWSPMRSA